MTMKSGRGEEKPAQLRGIKAVCLRMKEIPHFKQRRMCTARLASFLRRAASRAAARVPRRTSSTGTLSAPCVRGQRGGTKPCNRRTKVTALRAPLDAQ